MNKDRLLTFALAALVFAVYALTVAPGVTLWDAPEFVMAGSLLDVGHPPGATLFWLFLRVATALVPASLAALACNVVSAICMTAAVVVLGLVARELLLWAHSDVVWAHRAVVQSAASLSFAFLPSVWALAVEVEVYGCATLFALLPLWLALRWHRVRDWRLLAVASLVVGCASGVHWLAWLSLPAVGLVVGHGLAVRCGLFPSRGRLASAVGGVAGCALVALLYWLASGRAMDMGVILDVLCVNVLGLPVGSGLLLGGLVFWGGVLGFVFVSRSRAVVFGSVCVFLLSLGFVPSVLPLLRSRQGVAVAVGAPQDSQALADYMAREQYGHRALLRGPSYASVVDSVVFEPVYAYEESRHAYVPRLVASGYSYSDSTLCLFPRMQAYDEYSVWAYSRWVPSLDEGERPSLADNFVFFLRYQFGQMFVRYVLWNFCGRQNDYAADGGYERGNALSGFAFVDGARALSPFASGRVVLFGVPLLFCVVGLVVVCRKSLWRVAAVLALLALFAGPALVFFLNMPPSEPRERDYVFVLFYSSLCLALAFAVWRGVRGLQSLSLGHWVPVLVAVVPVLLLVSCWSAVSRRGNHFTEGVARSLLNACPPDAILLVGGDNDTYPLWYAQQVLGVRRDVRVVNYSLLSSPWHARQLLRAGRADSPLVSSSAVDVASGKSVTMLLPSDSTAVSPSPLRSRMPLSSDGDSRFDFFPSHSIMLTLADTAIVIAPSGGSLSTQEVVLLELLSSNPGRPLCSLADVAPIDQLGLSRFFWSLGPMLYFAPDTSSVSYLHKWALADMAFDFPDVSSSGLSADEVEVAQRLRLREMCNEVATEALSRADVVGARRILYRGLSWFPPSSHPADAQLIVSARLLAQLGDAPLCREVLACVADHCATSLCLASAVSEADMLSAQVLLSRQAEVIPSLLAALRETGNSDVAVGLEDLLRSVVD